MKGAEQPDTILFAFFSLPHCNVTDELPHHIITDELPHHIVTDENTWSSELPHGIVVTDELTHHIEARPESLKCDPCLTNVIR